MGNSNYLLPSEPSIYTVNGISKLKNTYYLVRHAESKANAAELVVSSLENGIKKEYGLTDKGLYQAKLSAELFVLQSKNFEKIRSKIRFFSSPFSRACETAGVFREVFGLEEEVVIKEGLAERFYGVGELGHSSIYATVWETDKIDESLSNQGSESVEKVRERMAKVILDIESMDGEGEEEKIVFLFSHGDPVYILEAFVKGYSFTKSPTKPYVRNAEIRYLN